MSGIINGGNNIPVVDKSNRSRFSRMIKELVSLPLLRPAWCGTLRRFPSLNH
jgi:hypothetical protein